MENLDKEGLDEFFKTGLTAPEVSEVDEDWNRMKSILLKKDKTRVIYYMILASSVAAVILLVFSILFYSQNPIQKDENIKTNNPKKDQPVLQDKATEQFNIIADSVPHFSESSINRSLEIPDMLYKAFATTDTLKKISLSPESFPDNLRMDLAPNTGIDTSSKDNAIAANSSIDLSGKPIATLADNSDVSSDSIVLKTQNRDIKNPKPSKNRFSLSFNLAPDLSGVENLKNTTMGYSIGTSLSYNFYKKFSIETGIAYGSKVYETDFSNYKPASSYVFPVRPFNVSANCEVLDVQLNLAYNLINKGKNGFGVAAGLSSYFMLQEKYAFFYGYSAWRGPRRYNIKNQNQHYLGVANLVLSYKRNLTNNTSLSFNPYYKLPLTDIGYGNIRLRSAGLNIGLTTNFKKSE